MESQEKIKILKDKGMEINNLDFNQLEFVYDIVINNKESENKVEKKQYTKISWDGKSQLQNLLSMLDTFRICKKLNKNRSSINIQVFSIFENDNGLFIQAKHQIILNKIKKRCDFYLTSDRWIKNKKPLNKEGDFIFSSQNKYLWTGSIDSEEDLKNLRNICSLVLNDHTNLKKEISNGSF